MLFKTYGFFITMVLVSGPFASYADEVLSPVIVKKDQVQKLDPHAIKKVERVSGLKIKNPSRQTLAEILQDQVGVEAQVYCSNCGAKRLTINGLRGENTSLLIDGLPLHSAVSSFYGVDSVPSQGIQDIEVMRGAGASLVNPEAIGGTLNIITLDPMKSNSSFSTSLSLDDELGGTAQNHRALVSKANDNKTFGLLVGGQWTEQESWDEDKNGIAESPQRKAYSFFSKLKVSIDSKNEVSFRASHSDLEILGGPKNATKPHFVRPLQALPKDFSITGDVESNYIGDSLKITDWISLKRYEGQLKWKSYISDSLTLNLNTGVARQEQKSIYQHGFDYAHKDIMWVGDLNLERLLGKHILKFGLFFKDQRLRSGSDELFVVKKLNEDSFDHQSYALYLQDTYIVSSNFEIDMALRADRIFVDWLDLNQDIKDFILAPRVQMKHAIGDHWTQRLSYGLGYRSPLTYFESQHGNNEQGYKIEISELEKAHSAVYSLSHNTPKYYSTFGAHYTYLENMAFGFEQPLEAPILYRNADENYNIWVLDLLVGYKVKEAWMLEASYEHFLYEDGYTKKLPTAAIEQRLQLRSTFTQGSWSTYFNLSWVPSRELKRYGDYEDHFRSHILNPTPKFQERKNQRALSFFLLDFNLTYAFNSKWRLLFGVNNLLDFTQAGEGDNPSAWHRHAGHAHYDGLHTWGPNRGREWYMQLSVDI